MILMGYLEPEGGWGGGGWGGTKCIHALVKTTLCMMYAGFSIILRGIFGTYGKVLETLTQCLFNLFSNPALTRFLRIEAE